MMLACVDVDYREDKAVAACILFRGWGDQHSADETVARIIDVEPYQAGHFYKRELPCILAVLERVDESLDAIVIDGYVWLRDETAPGLGAHLYEALGQRIPIIGVAKSSFMNASAAVAVTRGISRRPLYITAAGIDLHAASRHICEMHGSHRIPTLLKRVDQLSRRSLADNESGDVATATIGD